MMGHDYNHYDFVDEKNVTVLNNFNRNVRRFIQQKGNRILQKKYGDVYIVLGE